jgi:NifU-like protein
MPFAATIARRIKSGVRRRVERLLDRAGIAPAPNSGVPATASAEAAPPAPAPASAPFQAAPADEAGPVLTREEVEALFEDMVRPALQSDGGDITLVNVEGNDVYVRLLGACETCPSAIVTMQMGIERLLQEEFPHFGRLIRVDEPGPFGTDLGA